MEQTGGVYFFGGEKVKNRERQRDNRRKKHQETSLDTRNGFGAYDLTAYNAVNRIRCDKKIDIVLR